MALGCQALSLSTLAIFTTTSTRSPESGQHERRLTLVGQVSLPEAGSELTLLHELQVGHDYGKEEGPRGDEEGGRAEREGQAHGVEQLYIRAKA